MSDARSYYATRLRRSWGILAVREMARHRLRRVCYVGAGHRPRAGVQARGRPADEWEARSPSVSGRIWCVGSGRSLASRRAGGRRVGRERRRGRCSAGGLTDVFADVFAWIGTSGVSRLRALRAWLGSRRLRSRRACVSVVVPRAASGVGLAECVC